MCMAWCIHCPKRKHTVLINPSFLWINTTADNVVTYVICLTTATNRVSKTQKYS